MDLQHLVVAVNDDVRGKEARQGAKHIDVTRGQLVLENCDVTSDSLACIGVHGPLADPVVRRCKIHDSKSAGIFFYENAQGTIEECEIYGNTHAAVAISQGSRRSPASAAWKRPAKPGQPAVPPPGRWSRRQRASVLAPRTAMVMPWP